MFRYGFWMWLGILFVAWILGLVRTFGELPEVSALGWLGSAIFFACYFLIPVFQKSPLIQALLMIVGAVIVFIVSLQSSAINTTENFYVLLVLSYIVGEASYRLSIVYAAAVGAVSAAIFLAMSILDRSPYPVPFSMLYIILFGIALSVFRYFFQQTKEATIRYETLLHAYRQLKRKSITDEKLVRQQERTQIGREIHDSVGHKLTNLLMQLEVARMQADPDTSVRMDLLKDLAKESLEETRRAVKALKQEEIGGLPAIISLIRKLEAENFIRIHFSVKNRAFTASLGSEQMVAVYRAVQEALTNVMRHSKVREASVQFESPGESIFRFEISNPISEAYSFAEGYGLTSMRERVEQAGGAIEILAYQRSFIVRGTFPIHRKGGANDDPNPVS
ncbi:sensor histidine kinase [Aquibacillus koreensis]|uniref:histidine kinase n=1 Tax=Aquibacillus koreensis TaxID=279446 RepID=A0A9X4AK27_9BACI|nr:sensor histidine kinase [Aquibacillus koreensis]MCT2536683.1 sensor histidine kinase [Aquibacillus koreensis]MDC3422636.1 sensor histidine kinase [Aquibacillus koreensis]